ncbi:hypothetical protein DOTSEDRAFT_23963 [Dothistroma septosporum NZE10]|uniref:Uncharacterized protein n=1 Tax=Dothistroma septosporum (strain NZE10 / CBS 128990) TaxID=675120 RepID=N1PLC7_DOTSN|nr:hypothetical protein DOTSEDRAFT_23963 [Dothistroma septosporum NZE10]
MVQIALTTLLAFAVSTVLVDAALIQPLKRDLPADHGCAPCDGGDQKYYDAAQKAFSEVDPNLIAEGKASFDQTFEKGYNPKLCAAKSINCVTAGKGVKWTGDEHDQGLTKPVGRWRRKDGTETIAWPYWQSTLQWTCDGGSGTTYNAHCTIFTCAKGTMKADISTGGSVQGDGVPDNSAKNVCGCFPKDYLDTDIAFTHI